MQLVVSGNRILAHGEDCFIPMGGTVICTETGRVFQNATVVTDCENCPTDIDSVGYEYHAGVFVPCAPYGTDSGDGKIMVACDDCATPRKSKWTIKGLIGTAAWHLLAEYNTAGAYTFTVPDDVDELGVFILGGGNGGGAAHLMTRGSVTASGGDSGGLTQVALKKSSGDFVSGEEIPVVVGAGGLGGVVSTTGSSATGSAGGTSAFKAIVSAYGQSSSNTTSIAPYGLYDMLSNAFGYGGRNIFDPNDTHIYCGAGGCIHLSITSDDLTARTSTSQTVIARTKGMAGTGKYVNSLQITGEAATAPGDGGGGSIGGPNYSGSIKIRGGSGADGLVLVYGRKVV